MRKRASVRVWFVGSWVLLAGLLLGACAQSDVQTKAAETAWQPLFDGQTLENWRVVGDSGRFYVENQMIVGETIPDVGNSFLATRGSYDDFILEAEVKIGNDINSGIQIRSGIYRQDTTTAYLNGSLESGERSWPAGRVHGYQIEVDPSERAWTGGFYEEGGRGWLQPLTNKPEARKAFKPGEWNKLRIKAQGNTFKTWVNGVPAADTTDADAASGFIALQLHGAWKDEQIGQKVYWRNLRIQPLE